MFRFPVLLLLLSSPLVGQNLPVQSEYVDDPIATSDGVSSGSGLDWLTGYSTDIRLGVNIGETFSEPADNVTLDVFRPLNNWGFSDGGEQIQYLDTRVGWNFEGGGFANIGFGRRHYFADTDTMIDGNIWYDIDGTRNRLFHQVAAGGRIENSLFSLRGNYYLPVGDDVQNAGFTPLTGNVGYQGNNLALERFRIQEQAYRGFDAEFGIRLAGSHLPQLLLGYYNFEADNVPDISGYTAAVQAFAFENLLCSAQLTFDDEDDTSFMFTASYDISSRNIRSGRLRDRITERVRRTRHVVSRSELVYDPIAAQDASGQRINIIHANSNGSSNGTFESPYGNLQNAADDAANRPNSIVLVHADSVFDGQSVVLPEDTRFLGETLDHFVTTQQLGTIALPRATTGTSLPVIQNAPVATPAVTLANNLEVNGLRIRNARGTGLLIDGLSEGLSILDTTVDGAAVGMHIRGATGNVGLDPIQIMNTTGTGLFVEDTTASAALAFSTVDISNAGDNAIEIRGSEADSEITFEEPVTVDGAGRHGVAILDNSDDASLLFANSVTVANTGDSGIRISNRNDNPTAISPDIEFNGKTTVTGSTGTAVFLRNNGSNVKFADLAITDWMTTAIGLENSRAHLTVENPLELSNVNGSLESTILMTGRVNNVTFANVTIDDTFATSGDATVSFVESDSSVFDVTFANLNVQSTNRTALFGSETGNNNTTLVIGGGRLATTGATAVDLNGLSTDVTLDSVDVSDTPVGVSLVNVGSRSAFHDGFTINGGTFERVERGVVALATNDLTLNSLSIDSSQSGIRVASIDLTQPQQATIQNVVLTDAGGSANWVGIDFDWGRGAHFGNLNSVIGNSITGSGVNQIGIRATNVGSNLDMLLAVEGNDVSLTGAGSTGVEVSATGILLNQVANFGGITLSGTDDNLVDVPNGSEITVHQGLGATVEGSIRINGTDRP
ncbi:MAG: inverse autotransporter beta domain-containing protein [Planctomycetaceae bacterium]